MDADPSEVRIRAYRIINIDAAYPTHNQGAVLFQDGRQPTRIDLIRRRDRFVNWHNEREIAVSRAVNQPWSVPGDDGVDGALSALFSVLWCPVPTNVLGGELRCCCRDPLTGFYRDGYCRTGPGDFGLHTVCAQMTNEFLEFSYARGNDLVTPQPGFPGLKEGDRWCLCVTRWHEALEAGVAPPVDLHATHASALEFVTLEELQAHAST